MAKKKKKILKDKIELEDSNLKPKKRTPEDRAFELLGKKMEQQNK